MPSLPVKTIYPRRIDLDAVRQLGEADLQAIDRVIVAWLRTDVGLVNEVSRHIISSGGKRLRPLLVALSARAFGYDGPRLAELGAIVELIHTATLLHDDVVDASDLRRGRATANAIYGNDTSVLVGDFLYSRAFQRMVALGDMRIMAIMADTTNVIAEGEVLQLLHVRNPETTEERYLQVIRSKTAKLFEAAAQTAAVLAGASAEHRLAMARFGLHLGTAYQLVDDVLDYQGSPAEIGKNLGDDLAEGKPTLPLIHAMRIGTDEQAHTIREAIRNANRGAIRAVVQAVESTGAIEYTSRAAQSEANQAMQFAAEIPPSEYRDALIGLAEFSVARGH